MKFVSVSKNMPQGDYSFRDIFDEQIVELAEIKYPGLKNESELKNIVNKLAKKIEPVYILFPWSNSVFKCLPENEFYELKTNRNKLLIETSEQQKLKNIKVAIAGMSVGSSILYGLVGSGFASRINIADDDALSTSNLNRVSAHLSDVGLKKVDIAYRKSMEMNPFFNLGVFDSKIDKENIDSFLLNGSIDIIFEEIDDLKMKVVFREFAKRYKIPLVMLTNIGDSVLIDVERYDLNEKVELFNGEVEPDVIRRISEGNISPETTNSVIVSLVGRENLSDRILETMGEIGKTLVGRPQLYGTVAIDGGIAPYLIRRIFISNDIKSGRYRIDLNIIH